MCGIVGYVGRREALPILLSGLKKLEYRGYDSAGVAIQQEGTLRYAKKKGRISALEEYIGKQEKYSGTCGIGHTRWATHGEPTDENAHPHFNEKCTIGVVHNGIIENYLPLKEKMQRRGYTFRSETDSEVIAHMLDYYNTGDPIGTIERVLGRLKGSYALEILFTDQPDTIYCVRQDSPLVIGIAEDGTYLASDAPAILEYTREVYYPENGEIAVVKKSSVRFYQEEEELHKTPVHLMLDEKAAEKGEFRHFMMKEIYEQPEAIERLLKQYHGAGNPLKESEVIYRMLRETRRIRIVACGSAYHAGIAGKYVMESLARIPVEVDVASEFRYRCPVFDDKELVVVISQSGETADSLAALRESKKQGIPVLAIVNVEGSSIAREADAVLYTYAGPEISVATTKGYSTQLLIMDLMALEMAAAGQRITQEEYQSYFEELFRIPGAIRGILERKEEIQRVASRYANREHAFYIGRGLDYAIVLEGALKLKEISYVHAEAYAAGELKHGTIALLEEDSLLIAVETQPELLSKTRSNIIETKSRGAKIYGITCEAGANEDELYDEVMILPECVPVFSPSLAIVPLQLFAYYVSVARGIDVDKPRNLAKSVTVE